MSSDTVAPFPARHGAPRARRERTAAHLVAIVVGVLVLLPAAGVLTGGITLAVGSAVVADDDGYFRYTLERVESDGVAVAATDLWLDGADGDAPWVFDWLDVDLRVRAEGAGPTDVVFVGVARTADVERYLEGARWSEVVELDGRTAVTEDVVGPRVVAPPLDLDIWAARTSGAGDEELTWRARSGRWSIVVMNADGAAGVAADVELGARSGAITPIAATMIAVGGALTIGAVLLVVLGARGRRGDAPPLVGPDAMSLDGPSGDDRWSADDSDAAPDGPAFPPPAPSAAEREPAPVG